MQETFKQEFRTLCLLAFPMIIGGAANDIIPFINTAYMGRLGEDSLAAVALVNTVFVFVMVLFWGIFATVSTLISRYEGEERSHLTPLVFRSACVLAAMISIPVMIFFHLAGPLFILLGQNPQITQLAEQYFQTLSFAITPDFLLVVLYDLCFGLSRPKFVMYVCLLQIPMNLGLNYLFVFGGGTIPAFGIAGLGIGTAITYWSLLAVLVTVLFSLKEFRFYFLGRTWFVPHQAKELLLQGLPVGFQWVFEIGFFTVVALLIGSISPIALAAHQIAFQTYTLFFLIVYHFNQAVMIRASDGAGAGRRKQIWYSYLGGHCFTLLLAVPLMILCWGLQTPLMHFLLGAEYGKAPGLLSLASSLLFLAPIFFLTDSIGFTHFMVLRAYRDARYTMCVALVAYWVLALPLMWIGVKYWGWQDPVSLWWVMIGGSVLSLAGQAARFAYQYKRALV